MGPLPSLSRPGLGGFYSLFCWAASEEDPETEPLAVRHPADGWYSPTAGGSRKHDLANADNGGWPQSSLEEKKDTKSFFWTFQLSRFRFRVFPAQDAPNLGVNE